VEPALFTNCFATIYFSFHLLHQNFQISSEVALEIAMPQRTPFSGLGDWQELAECPSMYGQVRVGLLTTSNYNKRTHRPMQLNPGTPESSVLFQVELLRPKPSCGFLSSAK
jgi:hypothetical protein